ncbi:hypothetical protein [Vulcanisaeta sp. JCM 14467]|uniref:hypothetical protein n=1 Tax=Vulcanisaeta sp. JCM 14467 TaxID=1295370 RepID=UPI0006CF3D96|nr:hypothetical protein [Vulcanisaeta sp. JCM 14467]
MLFDSKPGRSFENFLKGREEAREGYEVDDKKVTELLQNLVDASFLTKENDLYKPSDPLIARAF